MKTLKEIYDIYKQIGATDIEIIEHYFTINHCEEQAIPLIAKLSENRSKYLKYKLRMREEWTVGLSSILCNEMPEKDKITLYNYVRDFTFYSDLDEKALKEVEDIFNKYDITLCPVYFIAYLAQKGIYKKETYQYWFDDLRNVLELREN